MYSRPRTRSQLAYCGDLDMDSLPDSTMLPSLV